MKIKLRFNENTLLVRIFKDITLFYDKELNEYDIKIAGKYEYIKIQDELTAIKLWKENVLYQYGHEFETYKGKEYHYHNLFDGSVVGKVITYKKWLEGYLNETKQDNNRSVN